MRTWPQEAPIEDAPIVFDPDVWRTSQDDEVRYDMLGVPVEEIVSIGMTQTEVFVRLGQGVDRGEGKWTWTTRGEYAHRRTLWITFDDGRVERAKVYKHLCAADIPSVPVVILLNMNGVADVLGRLRACWEVRGERIGRRSAQAPD